MILDTNLISEPMQTTPNARVMQWLNEIDHNNCFITAITAAELLAGVERLPDGKKKERLGAAVATVLSTTFANKILAFDLDAARHYAKAIDKLHRQGLNGMEIDAMIAGIALAQHMPVATRDTRPFEACGIRVINPWADE